MSSESTNDFDGMVARAGGDALFDLIGARKTWHGIVQGIAFRVAQWAAETHTNPIRKQRDDALASLESVKKHLEPAFAPVPGTPDKACRHCGAMAFDSGIGQPHTANCIYGIVIAALKDKPV